MKAPEAQAAQGAAGRTALADFDLSSQKSCSAAFHEPRCHFSALAAGRRAAGVTHFSLMCLVSGLGANPCELAVSMRLNYGNARRESRNLPKDRICIAFVHFALCRPVLFGALLEPVLPFCDRHRPCGPVIPRP